MGKDLGEFTNYGEYDLEISIRDDSSKEIQNLINSNYTTSEIEKSIEKIRAGGVNYYGNTDIWMHSCLRGIDLSNSSVCLFGSTHPWYELMLLHYGAKEVTVFEYSDRPNWNSRVKYVKSYSSDKKFDFGVSISSFEHDGLGRYGDPLDPLGDIKAMDYCKQVIKPRGLLLLSVPIGKDKVVFNLHRVYGQKRLPKLVDKWEWIASWGFNEYSLTNNINGVNGSDYQPVILLQNT